MSVMFDYFIYIYCLFVLFYFICYFVGVVEGDRCSCIYDDRNNCIFGK